jgi:hypothetical protein
VVRIAELRNEHLEDAGKLVSARYRALRRELPLLPARYENPTEWSSSLEGSGVATALLNRALEWARAEGYTRCAVDFEAANVPARRFWLRYFQPAALSFYRHIHAAS